MRDLFGTRLHGKTHSLLSRLDIRLPSRANTAKECPRLGNVLDEGLPITSRAIAWNYDAIQRVDPPGLFREVRITVTSYRSQSGRQVDPSLIYPRWSEEDESVSKSHVVVLKPRRTTWRFRRGSKAGLGMPISVKLFAFVASRRDLLVQTSGQYVDSLPLHRLASMAIRFGPRARRRTPWQSGDLPLDIKFTTSEQT
ncbi:uncharacterized protein FOMMEDRAFT_156041 [Fomitiporia mediterranea MF3/22]|uniref:uncharacterized protein n=1 Tax=Fomitiporia mediterranea (strain MF3/22) TaxID=694068 RepID=UPI00044075F8|nr:uncharacterized protein FOMMEDRAFT_156041 [Fomitiporia mediterranea MF3/22]EJD02708.1 hypothetical protein FOMMEDRAFT_156041 [Fomitiporia mediterranea MF3/22]